MNENEFELNGKVYVAVDNKECDGCAFSYGDDGSVTDGCGVCPRCYPSEREDDRSVIFVEKQP